MENQYPFLNGVLTEYKDGGLVVRNEPVPAGTQSLLILGTAVDGPTEPVAVDPTTVTELFGRELTGGVPNGSTLVSAFNEAYAMGTRDIRLMRISGTKARGALKFPATTVTYEAVEEELLGTKNGNDAVSFTLTHDPKAGTGVVIYANGMEVPPSAYELKGKELSIKANVLNAGAGITAKYTYTDDVGGTDVTETETLGNAEGSEQTFTLNYEPKPDTVTVMVDGVDLDPALVTISGRTVTVMPGAGKVGAVIAVSYARDVVEVKEPKVPVEAIFAGDIYNQTLYAVEAIKNNAGEVIGKRLIITKPAAKKRSYAEEPLTYSSLDYPTIGQLAAAVNRDALNNVLRLNVSTDDQYLRTADLIEMLPTPLTGGEDGVHLSRLELYKALDKAYHLLESYTVDHIVVTVPADAKVPGQKHDMPFAYQLALACAAISYRNHRVHGWIATSEPTEAGLEAVENHVKALEALDVSFAMRDKYGSVIQDADGQIVDLGAYITVVAGPSIQVNTSTRGVYETNSAAAIAGFVTTLDPASAPTNKALPEAALGLRYTYSPSQANRLAAKRFMTLKAKNDNTVVAIEDAPTAAAASSDYNRLSTVRAVSVCVNDIHDVADPFIGEPASLNNRNALASAIAKRLDSRKEAGVITDYRFQLIATPADLVVGQLKVQLTIVPAFELRRITTIVALTPSL